MLIFFGSTENARDLFKDEGIIMAICQKRTYPVIEHYILNIQTVVRDTKLHLDGKLCDDWCFEETKLDEDVSRSF